MPIPTALSLVVELDRDRILVEADRDGTVMVFPQTVGPCDAIAWGTWDGATLTLAEVRSLSERDVADIEHELKLAAVRARAH